jgi:hypothetical protein
MDRVEIEIRLNKDRAWLLNAFAQMPEAELLRGATQSEHDPAAMWTPKDHLAHLAGIEKNFVRMIRRHLAGDANPVGLRTNADGTKRTTEQVMAGVHEMTEAWVRMHGDKPLSDVVALNQAARAETLALLADLSDAQLLEPLPGAPWGDGTIGEVIATNAGHGRMHWKWLTDGLAAQS